MNPYRKFISEFSRLLRDGKNIPMGNEPASPKLNPPLDAPKALIFSPHPDDEVIIGALPLRLLRDAGMQVVNVAVTQGSNPARQSERWKELTACCHYIGFGLIATREGGLEGINLRDRVEKESLWKASVARIAEILSAEKPRVIFLPHEADWNTTHIGTHHLVVEALLKSGEDFSCYTVETEFWGAMDTPNLMIESSDQDMVDLITALSFHIGEVQRNPYHLRLPAWMMDNVRRGSELVGGQGASASDFLFATLYRLRRWHHGAFKSVLEKGTDISQSGDVTALFAEESSKRPGS